MLSLIFKLTIMYLFVLIVNNLLLPQRKLISCICFKSIILYLHSKCFYACYVQLFIYLFIYLLIIIPLYFCVIEHKAC